MSNIVKFGEIVVENTKGITPSYVHKSDVIVLNQKCIRNNRIDYSFAQYHDPKKKFSERKIIKVGDILINSTGQGTAGRVVLIKELPRNKIVIVDSHILIIRVEDFATAACAEYNLSSIEPQMQTFMDGSTGQGEFDKQRLFNIVMKLPEDDRRMASYELLNAIDTKIDVDQKLNKKLIMLTKTIFDHWFVQFDFPNSDGKPYKSSGGKMIYNEVLKRTIPEDWGIGTLDDVGTVVGGGTPSTAKPENYTSHGLPWITPNDLSANSDRLYISRGRQDISDTGIKDASLKLYPEGTVLLSSRAPVGYMAIAKNPLTTNQGFKSFVPNKGYSTEFVCFTLKTYLNAIIQYASGSTFKEISGLVIKTIKIPLPPKTLAETYTQLVRDIFNQQSIIEEQNEILGEIRNWLLPMLMSGQIKVT